MKQKAKSIVTALLLGVLCAVTLSAVITVPDWETARADLLIGMQYETTGLDLDAVPGWLTALVMLHQNFPLDGWAWGPAAAGLAVLLCWVRGQREAKPKRTELVLSIVFGIAEVLGLSICKLGSWAFVFKNPYQLCVGVLCMAGYAVLFYHAVWGLYALLGRSRTGVEDFPQTRFAAWFTKAPGRASSLLIGAAWLPWVAVFWPGSVDWDSWGQISQVLGVQEMTAHLDDDAYAGAALHFIGHLQTNKVRQVVGRVELIESVGSEHLLEAIEAQAAKLELVQDILLEVNIAGEESKGGCTPQEAEELAALAEGMDHVRLRGLMAIPPVSPEPGANRPFFAAMRQLFVDIKGKMAHNQDDMDCLSMGMSGDYADAIAEGSTLVRVGTALFGPRPPMTKQ